MSFKISSINVSEFNKYIKQENGKIVIDYISDGNSCIANSKKILCNRIEIIEGIGILFYLNDMLIKRIREYNLNIEFDSHTKTIEISSITNDTNVLYIYYNKSINRTEELITELSAKKYDIGSIVYPNNISLWNPTEGRSSFGNEIRHQTFKSIVYMYHYYMLNNADEEGYTQEGLNAISNTFAFEILENINGLYYRIRLKNTDNPSYNVLKNIAEKDYYATDSDLSTLEEIVEMVNKI